MAAHLKLLVVLLSGILALGEDAPVCADKLSESDMENVEAAEASVSQMELLQKKLVETHKHHVSKKDSEWFLSGEGEACADYCASAGKACEESGNWGIDSEEAFLGVVTAAGFENVEDVCRLVREGGWKANPALRTSSGICTWGESQSMCTHSGNGLRRFCPCVDPPQEYAKMDGVLACPGGILGRCSACDVEQCKKDCNETPDCVGFGIAEGDDCPLTDTMLYKHASFDMSTCEGVVDWKHKGRNIIVERYITQSNWDVYEKA